MTDAFRMRAITDATSAVLSSTEHAMSFDELQAEIARQHKMAASRFDVREAAWRLVNSQVALFTADRKVRPIPENVKRLKEMSS